MAITAVGDKQEFAYTGGVQEFIAPFTGLYKLEVWGGRPQAFQMYEYPGVYGGAGGYSVGYKELKKGTVLYVVCGGGNGNRYNGGGAANHEDLRNGAGATHIALVDGTLAEIGYDEFVTNSKGLIVAGGGGSGSMCGSWSAEGGTGGGLTGGSVSHYGVRDGGSQTSGYAFGQGGPGAGGGLYGGIGSGGCAASGGSGYIGGVPTITFKGTTYEPSTKNGVNSGNGKATITFVAKGELPVMFNGIPIGSMIHNGVEVKSWIHNGVDVFSGGTPKQLYIVKDGVNEGNFKYAGPSTGVATITSSDALKLEVQMTPSGVAEGFNFDTDLVDFTNYNRLVFNHKTTVNGGGQSAVTLKILDDGNNVIYTNTYITNTNASSSYSSTTLSDVITVDVSNYTGLFKVRLDCKIYGQGQKDTIEISDCHLE